MTASRQWFVDDVEKHELAQRLNWIESRNGSVHAIIEIDKTRAHMISVVWFVTSHGTSHDPKGVGRAKTA